MRCGLLEKAEDRELLFSLQYHSWQPGGLAKIAADLLVRYPEHLCTPSMTKFGCKSGQVYGSGEVKAVRSEIPNGEELFLLCGESSDFEILPEVPTLCDEIFEGANRSQALHKHREAQKRAKAQPSSYPAAKFEELCQEAAKGLEDYLARLCIDPGLKLESPWYFQNLISCLREYLGKEAGRKNGTAETEITKMIEEALEYALQSGELVPIQGLARIGKTHALKSWCERHPGQARYIQVPPTNDDASFFRSIAEALGVSSGLSFKTTQIRERVKRTAQSARLLLCFDEGHWLLTQDYRARKRPSRIAWIMTELVNKDVPVVLVSTPQFEEDKTRIKERTGWNWDQFDGRIGVPIILPAEISPQDLDAISRAQLPKEDFDACGESSNYKKAINALVGYAMFTKSQVAGIGHVVKRARFEAEKQGRKKLRLAEISSAIALRMPVDPEARQPQKQPNTRRRQSQSEVLDNVRQTFPSPGRLQEPLIAKLC
jgi:hypothetical protein